MVMAELPEPEVPRSLPPLSFSSPFAAPSLRWPSKKRLRCSSPAAPSTSLRSSPSRSPLRRVPPSPPLPGIPNSKCVPTASDPTPQPHLPGSPLPPCSPPPSDRPRFLVRLPNPRRQASPRDEDEDPPPPPRPTDLPSAAPTEAAGGGWGAEAPGRTLRSSSRLAVEDGEEKWGKRTRRAELWVPLSKGEIEVDFLRMTGSKPPRRRRFRRRSAVPDRLAGIFPGSWLPSRITTDRYRVAEPSNPREV